CRQNKRIYQKQVCMTKVHRATNVGILDVLLGKYTTTGNYNREVATKFGKHEVFGVGLHVTLPDLAIDTHHVGQVRDGAGVAIEYTVVAEISLTTEEVELDVGSDLERSVSGGALISFLAINGLDEIRYDRGASGVAVESHRHDDTNVVARLFLAYGALKLSATTKLAIRKLAVELSKH